jgi:hypothetical protein
MRTSPMNLWAEASKQEDTLPNHPRGFADLASDASTWLAKPPRLR